MSKDQFLEIIGEEYGEKVYEQLKDENGNVSKEKLLAVYKKTDVFLSHDWGTDEHGRSNHDRVTRINKGLKSRGLVTWFDSDRMEGDLVKAMCDGIDHASIIIVFVTKRYMDKVNGDNGNDNCQREFKYAVSRKSNKLMVPVVMERGCRNTSDWCGPVGMVLGGSLYIDFAEDTSEEKVMDDIVQAVKKKVRPLLNGGAVQKPPTLPPKDSVANTAATAAVTTSTTATATKPLASLTVEEACALLNALSVPIDADTLQEQKVTGELLGFAESEDDLIGLGLEVPSIKLRMLLSKLKQFKAQGVPLDLVVAKPDEGANENQDPNEGGEEDAFDPTDDADMANGYHVDCHEHPVFRSREDNGWCCDLAQTEDGCACGLTEFYQTSGWVKYSCMQCGYDMCKADIMKHATSEAEAEGGGLASIEVSVHDHPLYRDRNDNGWGCDGRNLDGGCRQGCTGFGQTAGWERYRCAACDFDLCRACADEYATM